MIERASESGTGGQSIEQQRVGDKRGDISAGADAWRHAASAGEGKVNRCARIGGRSGTVLEVQRRRDGFVWRWKLSIHAAAGPLISSSGP